MTESQCCVSSRYSAIQFHVYVPLQTLSHCKSPCNKILNLVPCVVQEVLFIRFMCSRVYLLISVS